MSSPEDMYILLCIYHYSSGEPETSHEPSSSSPQQHKHPQATKPPTDGTCNSWDISPATSRYGAVGAVGLPGQLSKGVCLTFKTSEPLGHLNSRRLCFISLHDTLKDVGWLLGRVTLLFSCLRSKRVKWGQPFLHLLPLIPLVWPGSALTRLLQELHTCKWAQS